MVEVSQNLMAENIQRADEISNTENRIECRLPKGSKLHFLRKAILTETSVSDLFGALLSLRHVKGIVNAMFG